MQAHVVISSEVYLWVLAEAVVPIQAACHGQARPLQDTAG